MYFVFFFFQAEDGIRDRDVTGVQTCALPISSGLGGRFPRGYPVAKVVSVQRDPGAPFALVKAEPAAMLHKSRHILLVDMPQAPELPPETEQTHSQKIKPQQAGINAQEAESE